MPSNETSFFSDPKVWIALLALVVSAIALVATLSNQWEQNRRWDVLNDAVVDLKKPEVKTWRVMSREKAFATQWGYQATVVHFAESDECRVLCRLRAYEGPAASAALVPGLNVCVTVDEIKAELARVGRDPLQVITYKDYTFGFELENSGKAEATDCRVTVFARLPDGQEKEIFSSTPGARILPGRATHVEVEMSWAPNKQLEPKMDYRVVIEFRGAHGNKLHRETSVSWDTQKNQWAYL